LCSKDPGIFNEITFAPRPLAIATKSGEILVEAKLLDPMGRSYSLKIRIAEELECTSLSGDEKIGPFLIQGPAEMGTAPAVIGMKGGICKMEFKRKNGEVYTLELPWGVECTKYMLGLK
jgi:hypothetical protein